MLSLALPPDKSGIISIHGGECMSTKKENLVIGPHMDRPFQLGKLTVLMRGYPCVAYLSPHRPPCLAWKWRRSFGLPRRWRQRHFCIAMSGLWMIDHVIRTKPEWYAHTRIY